MQPWQAPAVLMSLIYRLVSRLLDLVRVRRMCHISRASVQWLRLGVEEMPTTCPIDHCVTSTGSGNSVSPRALGL